MEATDLQSPEFYSIKELLKLSFTDTVQILVRDVIESSLCIRLDNYILEEFYSSTAGKNKLCITSKLHQVTLFICPHTNNYNVTHRNWEVEKIL